MSTRGRFQRSASRFRVDANCRHHRCAGRNLGDVATDPLCRRERGALACLPWIRLAHRRMGSGRRFRNLAGDGRLCRDYGEAIAALKAALAQFDALELTRSPIYLFLLWIMS